MQLQSDERLARIKTVNTTNRDWDNNLHRLIGKVVIVREYGYHFFPRPEKTWFIHYSTNTRQLNYGDEISDFPDYIGESDLEFITPLNRRKLYVDGTTVRDLF